MPTANKLPSDSITVEYSGTEIGPRDAGLGATHASNIVLELARALARMAAREDDAAENGGSP